MRKGLVIGAAMAGMLLSAAPASAENFNVAATPSSTFTPRTLSIFSGDTVTWRNQGGDHNVVFEDGSYREPKNPADFSDAWTRTRSFPTPGTFRYYCEVHREDGMTGTVTVQSGTRPPDTARPRLTSVSPVGGRFCNRFGRTCRNPGVAIRFGLSERAVVSGIVTRRAPGAVVFRAFGSLRFSGLRGANGRVVRRTRTGRLLTAGAYRVRMTARDAAGNVSLARTASFTVR